MIHAIIRSARYADRIGGTHDKRDYPVRTFRQAATQTAKETDKSRGKPLRGEGPRDQKSLRFLVAQPAPKTSKILEPLVFLRGSQISEVLESLGSLQEAS